MKDNDIEWVLFRIFYLVAKHGSFTSAARAMGVSQSAVSRNIARLEEQLGVSLFVRLTSGVELTEFGNEAFRMTSGVNSQLSLLVKRVEDYKEAPKGPLRITTSYWFGSAWMSSRILKFRQLYPDIELSMVLADDGNFDIRGGNADVAIWFERPQQLNLVQLKLMTCDFAIVASKSHIENRRLPKTPRQLDDCDIIVYGNNSPTPLTGINWLLQVGREIGNPRKPVVRINSVEGICRAVRSGLGIAAVPRYVLEDAPDLIEILPQLEKPMLETYFVYPEEYRSSKRVAVVRDFLLAEAQLYVRDVIPDDTRYPNSEHHASG